MRASQIASVPGIICSVWMRTSKMRKTPGEKKGKTWAMPWSKHSTLDEQWRRLWNSGGDKKHPLLSTWKNNGSYRRWTGAYASLSSELVRPGDRAKQTGTAAVLSNWGYKGQFDSVPAREDEKRNMHELLALAQMPGKKKNKKKTADYCGFRVETFPSSCNTKNLQNHVR